MPVADNIVVHGYDRIVNGFERSRALQSLPWPTAAEVDTANRKRNRGKDDHLLLGISVAGVLDFLLASGWPQEYERSSQDMELNGPLIGGQEIGYDVAAHIRSFMYRRGYQSFSVAEVLYAAGYYHRSGHATRGFESRVFLSHAQAELVKDTLQLAWQAASTYDSMNTVADVPLFIDYFVLRQCVADFDLEKIEEVIGTIGFTVSGLTIDKKCSVGALQRVWCGYEVYCTIAAGARYCAVMTGTWSDMPMEQIRNLNLKHCQATYVSDKATLIAFFDRLEGGAESASDVVRTALFEVARERLRFKAFVYSMLGCGASLPLQAFVFAILNVKRRRRAASAAANCVKATFAVFICFVAASLGQCLKTKGRIIKVDVQKRQLAATTELQLAATHGPQPDGTNAARGTQQ